MTPTNRAQIRKNGFSSVELIIVSIVILILLVFSIPMIQRNLAYYQLETGTYLLATQLTYARMEAIKRNRDVKMVIDSTNRKMTIKTTDLSGSSITLGAPTYLPESVVFKGTPPASVDFSSLGRNKINGNTVVDLEIYGTSDSKRITVAATGNIKSSTP